MAPNKNMKKQHRIKSKNYIYWIIGLILIILLALLVENLVNNTNVLSNFQLSDNYVTLVIDGDTFEIHSGESVRLICIDTPELGDSGSYEAKEFLEGLILNKEVRLEKDISETDKYGRLLRYVYVNESGKEVFVNKELVQNGYADVWRYGEDVKRCGEIED